MSELVSILFLGAVVGSLYALAAFGLVLTFRTSGVFNFAQGAIAMFFAFVFFQLTQGGRVDLVFFTYDQTWRLPKLLGLVLVVGVLAPVFGLLLDLALFRRLRTASTVVQIVATIGLLISLQGVVGVIWGAGTTLTPKSIFPSHSYEPLGVRVSSEQLLTILVALGLAAVTLAFLRYSPLGIRMRAVVDRPEVSELMGIDSRRISAMAWAVGTGFAALSGILVVPFYGTLDAFALIFLGIAATAAAVLARLESLPLTLAGGVGIGMAQFLVQRYGSSDLARQLRPSIPFIVLFAVLFLPRRWPDVAGPAYRPAGRERREMALSAKATRVGVLAAVLVVVPFLGSGGWQENVLGGSWASILALVPPMAIIFLSLVLLSGYAGQVSLCQAALAGFGAFIAAHLVTDWHWPFLLAVPVAGLATVPLGALLASRASRLPPLYLGFATLAFASLMDEVAFNSSGFSNNLQGIFFDPPELLQGPRSYYLFGLGVFAVLALLLTNLRNGRTGLALAAMRDSPTAVASVGEGVARLKLTVFCLSAFIAGVGGAMLAGASGHATSLSFFKLQSLVFLALAVIGGIGAWSGALAGACLFTLLQPLLHQPWALDSFVGKSVFNGQLEQLLPVFFGLGAIGLANNPNGMVEQIREGFAQFRDRLGGTGPSLQVLGDGTAQNLQRTEVDNGDGKPVTFPHARHFHRPGCVLATGKEGQPVTAAKAKKLTPCPVCEPELVGAKK
jgi:branched-subunit amino acid ABC-type transport system permease component